MDIVKHNVEQLQALPENFESIFSIMRSTYSDAVFAQYLNRGDVVNVTYSELFSMTDNISRWISSNYKNAESDMIGIYMENCVEWVACFWGILQAGFKPILFNCRHDVQTSRTLCEQLKPACTFALDNTLPDSINPRDIPKSSDTSTPPEWANEVILFTSGSTGLPKAVVHSGKLFYSQMLLSDWIVKKDPSIKHNRKIEIRMLAFLPFYHIFGLIATLLWFSFYGSTFIFLPEYTVRKIKYVCHRFRVTHFFAIPMIWDKVAEGIISEAQSQGKDETLMRMVELSNKLQNIFPRIGPWIIRNTIFKKLRSNILGTELTYCISGGGFINESSLRLLNGIGYSMHPGYGLTECGIVSVNLERRVSCRNEQNCGTIFPNIKHRISDDGELEISREHSFTGYIENGKFIPETDDYYYTNDLVKLTESGQLRIVGRSDDIVVTESGENISPVSAEHRLNASGFETASLLYARLDGKKQLVLALSESAEHTESDRAERISILFDSMERLALHEQPQKVILLSGKVPYTVKSVDRKKLTEMLEKGEMPYAICTSSSIQTPVFISETRSPDEDYDALLDTIKEAFAQITKLKKEDIADNSNFITDLGGDSLGYVDLLSALSSAVGIEVKLGEEVLLTPAEFAKQISAAKNK
ncbi:MAG: non-ribosomal peptide synthetase [Clostridia bacterium]|nr:non-ribosomal peptide synthetase [Clostridia bacterium]